MSKIEYIKEQITLVRKRTGAIVKDWDQGTWMETANVLETNLNWQIGHVILANYFHGLASVSGKNEEVRERMNVEDYIKFYGRNTIPAGFELEKPKPIELLELNNFVFELIDKQLSEMNETDLNAPVEVPNPVAKTKYDALMFMPGHQSWHNGQIAMLKRVLANQA